MITQERLQELFEYRDGGLYWRVPRSPARAGARAGYVGFRGYRQVNVGGKMRYEHRLIFLLHYGYLPGLLDHKDGNRINNRIENLRPCTSHENARNARNKSSNSSGVKGVSWDKTNKRWFATIRIDGRCSFLGRFDTVEAAKAVVDAARIKHHGEFARF